MASTALRKLAKQTIAQIEEAFATIPYPGDGDIADGWQRDDEYYETIDLLTGRHWHDLIPKRRPRTNRANPLSQALCFTSAAAFRFFLPAYFIIEVQRGEYDIFHIKLPEGRLASWVADRYCGLDDPQCRAILAYLDFANAAIAAELAVYPQYTRYYEGKTWKTEETRRYWAERREVGVLAG